MMQPCGGAIDAWEVGADVDLLRQRSTLEHNPLGWNQPSGLCPLKQPASARAFPVLIEPLAVQSRPEIALTPPLILLRWFELEAA